MMVILPKPLKNWELHVQHSTEGLKNMDFRIVDVILKIID